MRAKLFVLIATIPMVSLVADDKGAAPARHVDQTGGFSCVAPADWTVREFPGLKYQVVVGPAQDGFAPNLNIIDEEFTGTLDAYVDANLKAVKDAFVKFKLVKKAEKFMTNGKLEARRFTIESEQSERMVRQTFYLFRRDERMYVVTASALADGGDKFDKEFERCLKTFQFEDK